MTLRKRVHDKAHLIKMRIKGGKKFKEDLLSYNNAVIKYGGIPISAKNPQYYDYLGEAGNVASHYFLQDIHVAELVSKSGTKTHYDIGSRLEGFIAHCLANSNIDEVVMFDVRPLPIEIDKLSFIQTDATLLGNIPDNSIDSISSLHALEHFGLGRYGDPVDPLACFKAMKSIQRVASPDGMIYISTPVSMTDECVFNAHRIFSPYTVREQFDECILAEFAVISNNKLREYHGTEAEQLITTRSYDLGKYDCGIFVFRKNRKCAE